MRHSEPNIEDAKELLTFLPVFSNPAFEAINNWPSMREENGRYIYPYPKYHKDVEYFFRLADKPCWNDKNYNPIEIGEMLEEGDVIGQADLGFIRSLLTYCERGERFCDGHWGKVVRDGTVVRILMRLAELFPDGE